MGDTWPLSTSTLGALEDKSKISLASRELMFEACLMGEGLKILPSKGRFSD